jgi:hypothetical protein
VTYEIKLYPKRGSDQVVNLSLNFYREEINLPLGTVAVGLRECSLNFEIDNGNLPLRNRWPNEQFQASIDKKRTTSTINTESKSSTMDNAAETSFGRKSAGVKLKAGRKIDRSNSLDQAVSDEFELSDSQIDQGG